MQRFFTRQVEPFVFEPCVFDLSHGAAHGRLTHAEAAGHMKLAAILTPVAQSQQKLVSKSWSAMLKVEGRPRPLHAADTACAINSNTSRLTPVKR